MKFQSGLALMLGALVLGGCPQSADERNAFLRYTEDFGANSLSGRDDESQAGGESAVVAFRRTMTVTLNNNYAPIFTAPVGDLNVAFAAWVNVNSIRSAEQQDALIAGGYRQLSREVRLGSVFTLPPGTFVLDGTGVAGATIVQIESPVEGGAPTSTAFELITPDVLLFFGSPPISCDSTGFTFTDGEYQLDATTVGVYIEGSSRPIASDTGATNALGIHTLAQYDLYQCEPLRPGLFLRIGGGVPETNEFFEGQNITVDFFSGPDDNGFYANITRE